MAAQCERRTITFSPDGTVSDGTVGAPLVTGYGRWTWGPLFAPPPYWYTSGFYWVKLNGKYVYQGARAEVNFGGQLFSEQPDQNWVGFLNYRFQFVSSGGSDPTNPGWPSPPIVTGPFTPSPDGTSITTPVGSLVTADGVWTSGANTTGANYYALLNGVNPDHEPTGVFGLNGTQMTVAANGNLFAHVSDGNWYVFRNYIWQLAPPGWYHLSLRTW